MTAATFEATAFRGLVEEHADFVWRSLRRLGVPPAAAEDATQQVFLTLQARLGEVVIGKERSFLFGVAIRTAAHVRRTFARRREVSDAVLHELADPAPTPEAQLDGERERALLDAVLATMTPTLRMVFVMSELEELTMAEIAEVLAIPPGTVASRLRRAREEFDEAARRVRARLDRPRTRSLEGNLATDGGSR